MKRVTLYTVKTTEVTVEDRLKALQYARQEQLAPVLNSNEIVQTVETLPIYAVVNNGNTYYVAVSPEIRDIFLCLPTNQEDLIDGRELAQTWKEMYLDECKDSDRLWQEVRALKARLGKSHSFWNRLSNLFRSPDNWK